MMKKALMVFVAGMCLVVGFNLACAGEKPSQKIFDFANSVLVQFGKDPVIVEAVKAENAIGKPLAQIKEKDDKWKASPGIVDYMKAIMDSKCGKYLRNIQKSAAYYAEIFVMDDQGANVAMTDKTSDYWQGDEAKFQKSFNDGKGAVFVDEIEFDDSAQAYLSQISVPVRDGNKVIGAITFGIDIDKIE